MGSPPQQDLVPRGRNLLRIETLAPSLDGGGGVGGLGRRHRRAGLTAGRTRLQIRNVMNAVHNAERLPRPAALAEETRLFVELAAEAIARGGDTP